jgi:thioredoxin
MSIIACRECGARNRVRESEASARQPVCGKCGAALDLTQSVEEMDTSRPRTVTDATFADVLRSAGDRPLVLDCWAEWCGPCRMLAPVLDQLASESKGRYVVAKLNVDQNPRIASQFGVQSIPTLLFFKRGSPVDRMVGVQSKQAISARLLRYS